MAARTIGRITLPIGLLELMLALIWAKAVTNRLLGRVRWQVSRATRVRMATIKIVITGRRETVLRAVTITNLTSRIFRGRSLQQVSRRHLETVPFRELHPATVTICIQIVDRYRIGLCRERWVVMWGSSKFSKNCRTRGALLRELTPLSITDNFRM